MHTHRRNRRETAAFPGRCVEPALRKTLPFRRATARFEDPAGPAGPSFAGAWRLDLLTGPNHLYISTNEIAATGAVRGARRCAPRSMAPSGPADRSDVPGRKSCSPNQSSISPISATWSC
jgi:hypothetical protein